MILTWQIPLQQPCQFLELHLSPLQHDQAGEQDVLPFAIGYVGIFQKKDEVVGFYTLLSSVICHYGICHTADKSCVETLQYFPVYQRSQFFDRGFLFLSRVLHFNARIWCERALCYQEQKPMVSFWTFNCRYAVHSRWFVLSINGLDASITHFFGSHCQGLRKGTKIDATYLPGAPSSTLWVSRVWQRS